MLILLAVSSRIVTKRILKTCHSKLNVNSFRQIITNFPSLGRPIVDLNQKVMKTSHQKTRQSIDIFPQRQLKKNQLILLCGWHELWGAKCLPHCKMSTLVVCLRAFAHNVHSYPWKLKPPGANHKFECNLHETHDGAYTWCEKCSNQFEFFVK